MSVSQQLELDEFMARRHLEMLFGSRIHRDARIDLHCIDGQGKHVRGEGSSRPIARSSNEALRLARESVALGDLHTFVCPALRNWGAVRSTKNDIYSVRAVWLDIDIRKVGGRKTPKPRKRFEADLAALLMTLEMLPAPPSFRVHTGNGCHAYWVLNRAVRSPGDWISLEAIPRGLGHLINDQGAGRWEVDVQASNVAQPLRLAGSWNRKKQPIRVTIHLPDEPRVYSKDNATFQAWAALDSRRNSLGHVPISSGVRFDVGRDRSPAVDIALDEIQRGCGSRDREASLLWSCDDATIGRYRSTSDVDFAFGCGLAEALLKAVHGDFQRWRKGMMAAIRDRRRLDPFCLRPSKAERVDYLESTAAAIWTKKFGESSNV